MTAIATSSPGLPTRWRIGGDVELRKVGRAWVAIESYATPERAGIGVSVLTDALRPIISDTFPR